MSGILERVFSTLLQQGTAVARMAADQLAFERQEPPPQVIQTDYWTAPSDQPLQDTDPGSAPDRRGLTGSVRLLEDLTRLEQYAFETARRQLNLTETISLAHHDPFAFQRFRETGVLRFTTPMQLFDECFPGHYLRLIKRVRTTVVALIPPSAGIRATLSNTGRSDVVIGGGLFQTVRINRPESVALSAPFDATGVFELDPQPEMLVPFEGIGVDGSWELRLPQAANAFDFRTLADVMFSLDYTALDSYDYRQDVLRRLGRSRQLDRAFSVRREFADAWFDLHNPESSGSSVSVTWTTRREDFPANLEGLAVAEVQLVVAREGALSDVPTPEFGVTDLALRLSDGTVRRGGPGTSVRGVISADRGAPNWRTRLGGDHAPIGEWTLTLPASSRQRLREGSVTDLILIISVRGLSPAWPA